MVADALWATSGLTPNGGMLCLRDLEQRLGRPLVFEDFTAIVPEREAWEEHVERRAEQAVAVAPEAEAAE